MVERTITNTYIEEDYSESNLRPQYLNDFIGQSALKSNMNVYINAAKKREEAIEHILLHGPPGLGKTTLAQIIANEMGVGFRATSGPIITKTGDLAALLTNLQQNDVLFIDEIHRLNISIEEVLYTAMEDFKLDIMIGEGPAARSVRIDLPAFTLVGATTRAGLLSQPLRERFGIPLRLEFYSPEELIKIISRAARILDTNIEPDAAFSIAKCARGTPRIASRLFRRVRDFATASNSHVITKEQALFSLKQLNIDEKGLDMQDKAYLMAMHEHYNGGPVGIETLAAFLSEERDTLEDVIEPYLIQLGFVLRTPRGRMLSDSAKNHLMGL